MPSVTPDGLVPEAFSPEVPAAELPEAVAPDPADVEEVALSPDAAFSGVSTEPDEMFPAEDEEMAALLSCEEETDPEVDAEAESAPEDAETTPEADDTEVTFEFYSA